jgi:hypothetical protein
MDNLLSPEIQEYLILFLLSAIISYGSVEVLKLFVNGYISHKNIVEEPWWHKPLCRLLSIVVGTGLGVYLGTTYIHCAIGCAAGVMNTFVVMIVKQHIKKKVGSE